MRKFFSILSVMAIALATTTAFTSCGSDDDEIIAPILTAPVNPKAALVGHKLTCENEWSDVVKRRQVVEFKFTTETDYEIDAYYYQNGVLKEKSNDSGKYRYDGSSVVEMLGADINTGEERYQIMFYLEDGVWKSPAYTNVKFE